MDDILRIDNVLKWGRRTLTLIPGFSVIFTNLWLPKEISHSLVGGILEAVGIMTLIIFEINKKKSRSNKTKSNKNKAIGFLAAFLLVLFGYIGMYDSQVIYSSKYEITILFPFWNNNELEFMIAKSQGTENAITNYGPEAVRMAIQRDATKISNTKIIFMLTYLCIFEMLIIAFSYIGIDLEKSVKKSR
ncbi:hypothetical protein FHW88_003388 [Mucilaginibacter sp. SG538B]|uniref:hypothetical protein n=1 Tax=Mucilaginibacter sp. SG538B TaxID=2587021 RepID=UPI00159D6063|nr:hypothetical protein [Mucilaginibacter sp. SG538B]NVM65084.1 hypothetical protein [Mucilaginibacter sp. SG538B]